MGDNAAIEPKFRCELVGKFEHQEEASGTTAILRPIGAGAEWSMKRLTELWYSIGDTERELREVLLLAVQVQLPGWEADELHTWSPDLPRPLAIVWNGTGRQRGQVRVRGSSFSESERNAGNRQRAWALVGATLAFFISNRITLDRMQNFKWCPLLCTPGSPRAEYWA